MKRIWWMLLAVLVMTSGVGAQTTQRLNSARQLWEKQLRDAANKPIVSKFYPTEAALVFLTAYDFTRDARFAMQADVQLEYSHARESEGLLLTSDRTTTRDYQARQIYNFYLAYRILAEGKYLHWADACAAAMIRVIPRSSHSCAGETHVLFEAGYFDATGKPVRENGNAIDVNQNAEIGLAFSLLYHDPASRYFRDPLARQIAYEELLASMSLQDMHTGAIPLHESFPGDDTAYGSYATFSWTWCQILWREAKFEPHVRAAGKWLGPKMNLKSDSQRFYPKRIDGGEVPDWEAYYRLPLLWYCGIESGRFVRELFERGHAPLYWAYYDLMGMPREFFVTAESRR